MQAPPMQEGRHNHEFWGGVFMGSSMGFPIITLLSFVWSVFCHFITHLLFYGKAQHWILQVTVFILCGVVEVSKDFPVSISLNLSVYHKIERENHRVLPLFSGPGFGAGLEML